MEYIDIYIEGICYFFCCPLMLSLKVAQSRESSLRARENTETFARVYEDASKRRVQRLTNAVCIGFTSDGCLMLTMLTLMTVVECSTTKKEGGCVSDLTALLIRGLRLL